MGCCKCGSERKVYNYKSTYLSIQLFNKYIKKKLEISQIKNLSLHLEELEKVEKSKTQAGKIKEIIKIILEVNESRKQMNRSTK